MVMASIAAAQNSPPKALTVLDLELGSHAAELPPWAFADMACGTNGGPPSRKIESWLDYAICPAEAGTGLREIYFRHDDEVEYRAKAQRIDFPLVRFGSTTVYGVPVIASGLFDDNGFLAGLRVATDPRGLDEETRQINISLWNFFRGRFGGDDWNCTNLDVAEGEQAFGGQFLKRRCETMAEDDTQRVILEGHYYRKRGQFAIDPRTQLGTQGQFESTVRLELLMAGGIGNAEGRLAALEPIEPQTDPRVALVHDCPGCDLAGEDLKRADLRGANLAGANLAGANLHDARLDGANLAGANLSGAILTKATLKRANLEAADLSNAMLFKAKLDGANLRGANLQRAMAGEIELIGANLQGADIRLVDLRDSRLARADMTGADLSGSHLHNARMGAAKLKDAIMVDVVAINAQMTRADLSGADLRRADLYGTDLREANLSGADLVGARLARAILLDANLDGARRE